MGLKKASRGVGRFVGRLLADLLKDDDADDELLDDADAADEVLADADDTDELLDDADAADADGEPPTGPFDAFVAAGGAAAEDTPSKCEHCLQEWSLAEAVPLTALCEHGSGKSKRVFAEAVRVQTLPDGRVTIILDFAETVGSPASQGVVMISNADGEKFRGKLARRGASALADRWRP